MDGSPCCSVVELRQYALVPGRRADLIDLFESDLLDPQRVAGMHVVGTFADLDDPDRFVWIRGYQSDESRTRALEDFYLGPVWAANRDRANATMVDSDNVLLLRPVPDHPISPGHSERADVSGAYSITVYALESDSDEASVLESVHAGTLPAIERGGGAVVGVLRTNPAPNGFPRLPVRTGERVVVVVSAGADGAARQAPTPAGTEVIQRVRLAPTALSELR